MIRQTLNLNEVVINPCSCVSVQFWMKKNIKEHVCCFVGIAILPLTHAKKKDFRWPKKPKAAASQVMEDGNGVMADMIRFIIQG